MQTKAANTITFDGFDIRNSRTAVATATLAGKSCSCFRVDGVPATLAPGGAARLTIVARGDRSPGTKRLEAKVRLNWEDDATELIMLRQDVTVMETLQILPRALTFEIGDGTMPTAKKMSVTYRYRSRVRKDAPSLHMATGRSDVVVTVSGESRQSLLGDDLWECVWDVECSCAPSNDSAAAESRHIACRIQDGDDVVAVVSIPVTIRPTRGIDVFPTNVYYSSNGPRAIMLRSKDGKPFAITSVDGLEADFDVRGVFRTPKPSHIIVVQPRDGAAGGVYRGRIATSAPTAPTVEVELVLPRAVLLGDGS